MKTVILGILFLSSFIYTGCSQDIEAANEIKLSDIFAVNGCTSPLSDNYDPNATENDGTCAPTDCSKCDFFVAVSNESFGFDGEELGVKPGDIICLDGSRTYTRPIAFKNIQGTAENPVLITNCNGQAKVDLPGRAYAISTNNCQFFRITGAGDPDVEYGISISNVSSKGLDLNNLSSNFEIDRLEISKIGFAGIMAKTDPTCDDATTRGNFTMRDVSIHHNYVHDTDGEGFYIGNSFYANGRNLECGKRLPHDIVDIKVYSNIFRNTGWEALQVGCAIQGAEIYNNDIENFGMANKNGQRNGIQIGEGTGGLCYNNRIVNGNGNGMNVLGYGDNIIFNNLIVDAKRNGVFCDERYSPGDGFKFYNNTIVNPGIDGIKILSKNLSNKIYNNIIVNPGFFDEYENDNKSTEGEDAYVNHRPNTEVKSNYFTRNIEDLKFINANQKNFDLSAQSPAIDSGRNITSYDIIYDLLGRNRSSGDGIDIGAFESQ
ncbi:right-handed parallel beta-helix repeat-containing protein [Marivirga sp. S37H4]|uniref:Right-handed parallel beta-helix repeat-containing protein n=1 Tax=Marivirga aurantiaca TaxID=2802615 RepID=A0A934X123_9BACT|nr:right-handed parallel beta-helix repeat-containing protein [Marivirga aurantiaca]MBK6266526.1 right-handed parallel beta-helix repeat-containing protein [Marivirga aurantiaca]